MPLFTFIFMAIGVSVLAFAFTAWLYNWVKKQPAENARIAEVSRYIREGAAGVIGIRVATMANGKTAEAAQKGIKSSFMTGFRGGAVMGMAVVGSTLLGVALIMLLGLDTTALLGFSFGASSLALFAKAGGGIFTKSADISADLTGKVELGIPEDDPRNPAVIADNVGDNVGDVAGMGADLFDSNVASMAAALVLAGVLDQALGTGFLNASMVLCYASAGLLASIIGIALARMGSGGPTRALNNSTYITTAIFTALTAGATAAFGFPWRIWGASIIGLAVGVIIGIAMAAVGMLSIVGMIISNDAYGPIVDNARGLAEMGGLGDKVLDITDQLDSAGNTVKAVTKGFAIGAAGLTVIALLGAFISEVNTAAAELIAQGAANIQLITGFDIMNPTVFFGMLVGGAVPAVFSAMLILGVDRNAQRMVAEIHRQFTEIAGLKEGKPGVTPEYERCIEIATVGALGELIPAGLAAILITLAVGFVGGVEAIGGFLCGNILTGLLLALFMSNAGGLWDNAKKYVESGHNGGKGSDAHKAAVVGDTVGDPFKDTAGPSINTQITVVSLVASLCATLFLTLSVF